MGCGCQKKAIGSEGAKLPAAEEIVRHCDVCILLDGDYSPKETTYCYICDKFLCAKCKANWWRRVCAALQVALYGKEEAQ
jgi:hypothetical protein